MEFRINGILHSISNKEDQANDKKEGNGTFRWADGKSYTKQWLGGK